MKNKLELWYPAKPFWVNQVWGLYNPAYERFGFNRHNGIDLREGSDRILYCPVKARVNGTGYLPAGAGNYVQLITTDKWLVDGVECYVEIQLMHNEEVYAKVGDTCEVGTILAKTDNTGFSTGPHIHFGAYRLNDDFSRMDTNNANGSFDPLPYFCKFYAKDHGTVMTLFLRTVSALKEALELKKKV